MRFDLNYLGPKDIWFVTDDFGNQIRFVRTANTQFSYPAVDKKIYAQFMSWGTVDGWGSPVDWQAYYGLVEDYAKLKEKTP